MVRSRDARCQRCVGAGGCSGGLVPPDGWRDPPYSPWPGDFRLRAQPPLMGRSTCCVDARTRQSKQSAMPCSRHCRRCSSGLRSTRSRARRASGGFWRGRNDTGVFDACLGDGCGVESVVSVQALAASSRLTSVNGTECSEGNEGVLCSGTMVLSPTAVLRFLATVDRQDTQLARQLEALLFAVALLVLSTFPVRAATLSSSNWSLSHLAARCV